MRALRVSVLSLSLLFLFAAGASANVIDPVIVVRGGGGGSITLTSPAPFTILFPGQPGCNAAGPYPVPGPFFGLPWMACVIRNVSGTAFNTLTFNINTPQLPLTLQCPTLCSSFGQTPSGGIATFVFNPPIPPGPVVPADFEFVVDFINFTPGTNFTVTPNVPEPATALLFGTGAVAVWWKRRHARA